MSRALPGVVTLVFSLLVAVGAAQVPSPPPRPASPPAPRAGVGLPPRDQTPRTGNSRIAGRVVDATTGRPIRRAAVRVTSPALGPPRTTLTDANGSYEFTNLPAGPYQATASKTNYVQASYGQTRVQEVMRPFPLADKQSLERIDFALPRGGVIAGRVVDEFGEPVTDVQVAPMRNQYSPTGGRRPQMSGRSVVTNDIGEFRLYGLTPGDYYVSATSRNPFGIGSPEVSDDRTGYAPTYYPSANSLAEAQAIRVAVAQTVSDVTIVLSPTRTATLTGIALDADGQPLRSGGVNLMPRTPGLGPMTGGGGQIRPDGTFSIPGVVPGQYVLRANGSAFTISTTSVGGGGVATVTGGVVSVVGGITGGIVGAGGVPANASRVSSVAFVDVHGDDISGIVLAPVKPATITGRFVGDAAALAAVRPGATRVTAQPASFDEMMSIQMIQPTGMPEPVRDDLTFTIQTGPGRVLIRPQGMAATLKAIYYQGVDVTDQPIEVRDGAEIRDVEIELTTKFQSVSGVVTDARGSVPASFTVVLFATDSDKWTTPTRFVTIGRPNAEGRYTARLPVGDFYAAAVEYVEPGQWTDPEFLSGLRGSATRFSLGEGETRTLDLRLAAAP
jgi:protocatechuate 3,4-dioxygenase beta subunit